MNVWTIVVIAVAFAASLILAPAVLIWGELADRRTARQQQRGRSR